MSKLESAIRKAITEAEKTGKLGFRIERRFERVPLATFREVCRISQSLSLGEMAETIDSQAKDICEHFGVLFMNSGIGWTVC